MAAEFRLKKILFPVDFSEQARGAAAYVEALAGRFDADIILLYVVEPPTYDTVLSELAPPSQENFDKFLGRDLRLFRVEKVIEHGEAASKIVELAHRRGADLIMIPTRGLGIFRRLILGSTAAKVLHDADCPVWTGVHMEAAPPLDAVATRRVLCAVDLKPTSPRVLDWANHIAAEYQAELALLHVLPLTPGYLNAAQDEQLRKEIRRLLDGLKQQTGSPAEVRIEEGDPDKVVAEVAREWGADLLVIGRRGESGILGRLERTAYSIIRQSPCPVVSV